MPWQGPRLGLRGRHGYHAQATPLGKAFEVARYRGKHAKRGRSAPLIALVLFLVVAAGTSSIILPGLLRRSAARSAGATKRPLAPRPMRTVSPSPSSAALGPGGVPLRAGQAAWVIAENQKRGTRAWRIPPKTPTDIEGYADHVSAVADAHVTLY